MVLEGISKVVFGCPNFRFGGCGSVINANDAPLEDHPAPLVVSSIVMLSARRSISLFLFHRITCRQGDRP